MPDMKEACRRPLPKALIDQREAYVKEWSMKSPEEIQAEIGRLHALVLDRDGFADAYGLEPAWTVAALQQALDNARELT